MGDLPRGHIANKSGEIAKHGRHVDLVASTSYGSHQVRVVDVGGHELCYDENGNYVGGLGYDVNLGGHVVVEHEDQHNFGKSFDDGLPARKFSWEDRPWDDRFNIDRNGNLHDRCLGNGLPDPRGTAMGGYNRR